MGAQPSTALTRTEEYYQRVQAMTVLRDQQALQAFYDLFFPEESPGVQFKQSITRVEKFIDDVQPGKDEDAYDPVKLNVFHTDVRTIVQTLKEAWELDKKHALVGIFQAFGSQWATRVHAMGMYTSEFDSTLSTYATTMQHWQRVWKPRLLLFIMLEDLINEIVVLTNAFYQLAKSDFQDLSVVPTLFLAARLTKPDYDAVKQAVLNAVTQFVQQTPDLPTQVVELEFDELVDDNVFAMFDATHFHWIRWYDMTQLPHFGQDVRLFAETLKQAYLTARAKNTVVSEEVANIIQTKFEQQVQRYNRTLAANAKTLVLYVTAHGSAPVTTLQKDPFMVKPVFTRVPPGCALTRIAFVPPGYSNISSPSLSSDLGTTMQRVLEGLAGEVLVKYPQAVVSVISKIIHELRKRRLQPKKKHWVQTHFVKTFMKPQAAMYLAGEQYLAKTFSRTDRDHVRLFANTVQPLNWPVPGDVPDFMGDAPTSNIDMTGLWQRVQQAGYNHLILVDGSCSDFQLTTTDPAEQDLFDKLTRWGEKPLLSPSDTQDMMRDILFGGQHKT